MGKVASGRRSSGPTAAGRQIIAGLTEAVESLRRGENPADHFPSRTYELPVNPAEYDAATVRALRQKVGASQSVFARLVGVSVKLVQAWEQGRRVPSQMARRLMDMIGENPDKWPRTRQSK